MIIYIYDGSFEGLLTSIYDAYYSKEKPEEIVKNEEYVPSLITNPVYISSDYTKASKVSNAIKEKISPTSLNYIYYAYLSDIKGNGTAIYNYVKLGFRLGKDVDLHLIENSVLKIHQLVKKVTFEYHRFLGFVRFKNVKNKFLYAPIEPDHNILSLITEHFIQRLSNEYFIIHDLKRDIATIYNKREWVIYKLSKEESANLHYSQEEVFYEDLWKDYFESIAINDRLNPKLQKRMMPQRYWKYLTEIQ